MDWLGIGVSAIAGSIAAGMVYLIVPQNIRERTVGKLIFAAAVGLAVVMSQSFILPQVRTNQGEADLVKGLAGNPAFEAIKEAAPDAYSNMVREAVAAVQSGKSDIEVQTIVRRHMTGVLEQKMPHASDDALIGALDLMVDQLIFLSEKSDTWCVRFMFPDPITGVGFDPAAIFPPSIIERDFESSARVILSYNPKRQIAPAEFASGIVEPIAIAIHEKYGEEAFSLPDQNPSLTCQAAIELFSMINKLYPLDRAIAFRWMLTE